MISELLFFMQNKMHTTPHNKIVEKCVNFYDLDYILKEKEKFFKAIDKKCMPRQSNDKNSQNRNDILVEMHARDNGREFQPVFVAAEIIHLPASTNDGSVSNTQVFLAQYSISGENWCHGNRLNAV